MLERIGAHYARLNTRKQTPLYQRYPELANRQHLFSSTAKDAVTVEAETFADYARVYQSYVWVRKAITKMADAIVSLPVRVVDEDSEEVTGHPLNELFTNVNDSYDQTVLWSKWVVHMMLGGEWFCEIVPDGRGNPVELWVRRPDKVLVIPDASLPAYPKVLAYKRVDDEVEIPPQDMIADKFINPLNEWRGIAPIAAVRAGITIDLFAQAWSRLFLQRGARPDWALVAPEGLTPTEREEYETKLYEKFAGVEGWHRPIILENGVTDVKTLSFTPKDIEWLEQRKFSRDEVGALFGVPDEIMGYGRDTYENFETALTVFWLLTLKPLVDHRDTVLTRHFTKHRPMLQAGQRIKTDLSEVGVLQEDLAPKLEIATKFFGMGVPYNTVEERLGLGTGPIPGGDVGYLPINLIPVGARQAGNETEPTDDNGEPQEDVRREQLALQESGVMLQETERMLKRAIQKHQNVVMRALRERQPVDWDAAQEALVREIKGTDAEMVAAEVERRLRAHIETLQQETDGVDLHDRVSALYQELKNEQIGDITAIAQTLSNGHHLY